MVVELTLNVWSLLRVCLARYFELSGFTTRSAPPQARKYGNFIVGLSLWILSMAVNIALTHLTFIPPCQFSGSSTYFLTLKNKSHSISQANLGRVMEGKKCTPWSFHPCYYSYPLPPPSWSFHPYSPLVPPSIHSSLHWLSPPYACWSFHPSPYYCTVRSQKSKFFQQYVKMTHLFRISSYQRWIEGWYNLTWG